MGHRGDEGDGPAEDADDGGPLDVGEGEDVERGADGEVALQGEREDRQHWGVRGAANNEDSDLLPLMKSSWRIWIGGENKIIVCVEHVTHKPFFIVSINLLLYLSERKDLILQKASPNVYGYWFQ